MSNHERSAFKTINELGARKSFLMFDSGAGPACGQEPAMCAAEAVPHAAIAQRAYFRALHRGFSPGHEREDWLAAEAELKGLWFAQQCAGEVGDYPQEQAS